MTHENIKATSIKRDSMRNKIRIAFVVKPGGKKVFLKVLVFCMKLLPHKDGIITLKMTHFQVVYYLTFWKKLKPCTLEEAN